MRKQLRVAILFISGYLLQNSCLGQPFSLDERIQPTELNLVDYKKDDTIRKGRINMSEITQNKDTAYYFVKGLSMYSPVYFGLTTNADAGNIKVHLCKDNWAQVNQDGETGSAGHWQANFKTEGDFGIMVIPENKPADYSIIVWAGAEAKEVGVTSPFSDGEEKVKAATKNGNFLKDNLVYILGALVLVLVVALFIKNKKRQP